MEDKDQEDYQDLRDLKVILETKVHKDQKVQEERWDLKVNKESQDQLANKDQWE